jgi:putative transposase
MWQPSSTARHSAISLHVLRCWRCVRMDQLHLDHPVYGSRKLTVLLRQEGSSINRNRVVRLLRLMGIEAIYAKPKTSLPEPGHQIYHYLLRDLEITGPDQV